MKALLIAVSTALAAVAAPSLAKEPAAMDRATVYARLDRQFEAFARERHVPGLVYGVVVDGKLAHVKAFGVQDTVAKTPVTADSVFRIASMTKNFTALAALSLRDEGKLSLDAPVETIVPQFTAMRRPDEAPVRVRDLIAHTGGFVTDDPWGDRQLDMSDAAFDAFVSGSPPVSRPNRTAFEYSNFGYATLGRVISNVSGRPYADYVRDTILGPLGMVASGFEVSAIPAERRALGYGWIENAWVEQPMLSHGAFGAMGGLSVSANDYARYVAWLLDAWPARDAPQAGPLTRATVREIAMAYGSPQLQPRSDRDDPDACDRASAYGAGTIVVNDCELGLYLTHSGGLPGYGSNVLLLPDRGVGVFAFANVTYAPASFATREAALTLHRSGLFPPRDTPASAALERARDAVVHAYAVGDIAGTPDTLAMNFLLDRDAKLWNRELWDLADQLGFCSKVAPIQAKSAMAGTFTLLCEKGELDVMLVLAPTKPQTIQKLTLTPRPAEPAAKS